MTILPCPPPGWKRPSIPLATQVALLKAFIRKVMGTEVNIDHRPPVSERPYDEDKRDTVPSANDIAFLEVLTKADHDVRTFGTKATSSGSDAHSRAKVRHLTADQAEFRRRLLAKTEGESEPERTSWPKRKIQGRGFQRRGT